MDREFIVSVVLCSIGLLEAGVLLYLYWEQTPARQEWKEFLASRKRQAKAWEPTHPSQTPLVRTLSSREPSTDPLSRTDIIKSVPGGKYSIRDRARKAKERVRV